ncbi:hypothetical protein Misp01_29840 [Microtetraspora sp. NBRC 13810]|uniref:DUF4142 domain-containing protein n=1 Tax=Microtetraspora sp. NBRC 13810 TaxID=3030990 RepID=UPI0024A25001|nr:DUF4142 domain-containing protein [Microtetraspora sp. NBRC 13810]GLW07854.1 hypothetical protein Misp01_29840 [Microtetraspora sp. NBRC 13810]
MTKRIVIMLAVALAAMCPAVAGAAAPPGLNEQDRTFLAQAHQANLAEIEAGRSAESRGATARVRELGSTLVRDHTKLDGDVRRSADKAGVQLPGSPDTRQREQLAQVDAKSGKEYDRAWVAMEIAGHRQTLSAIAEEEKNGSSAEVKDLAAAAKPVVQKHLDLLQAAQKNGD